MTRIILFYFQQMMTYFDFRVDLGGWLSKGAILTSVVLSALLFVSLDITNLNLIQKITSEAVIKPLEHTSARIDMNALAIVELPVEVPKKAPKKIEVKPTKEVEKKEVKPKKEIPAPPKSVPAPMHKVDTRKETNSKVVFYDPINKKGKGRSAVHNKKDMKFIRRFLHVAQNEAAKYNIPVSIQLAQGILESHSGTSALAVHANNYFGVKRTTRSFDGPFKREGLI
jgi:flagellum-specific peptidoglycan hydrolase FlgJ